MLRNLLLCGLAAGAIAGLIGFGFASLAGEPAVNQAIAYEEAHEAHPAMAAPAAHESHAADAAPVPRSMQKSFGLLTALLVFGLSVGGIYALAFAFAYGRVGRASPRVTAYWLAACAFVVVYLVPFLKYPATPPAVGNPDTIGKRTALYVTMMAISVLAAIAAARLRPALLKRMDGYSATILSVLAYVAIVVVAGLALPGIHEVPATFPATTLWRFREASIGLQAVLWTTIGLVFAFAAQRVLDGQPVFARRRSRREPAVPAAG